MTDDIKLMLDLMDRTFQDYESSMPNKPNLVELSFGAVYRFNEKDIYQAMILKLARILSLVRAAILLFQHGYVQEQSILHRTIDETNEDVMFLVYAITNGEITDLHERFLEAFWEEEIDESGNMIDSNQNRAMIPRRKIHAYLSRIEGLEPDPSSHQEVIRTISKAYSGFVHGAAPHIMDMYGGHPPHFHTSGMLGTPRMVEHEEDLWNYVYRSFISFVSVGKALGAAQLVEILTKHLNEIERKKEM